MPGLLRPDAKCPVCGTHLMMLVDTTRMLRGFTTVKREYYHEKPDLGRRKGKCTKGFSNYKEACLERKMLEMPFLDERKN